ncbi:MAG: hypothetical protein ACYTDU_07645 [Planctomycetota bacterium]|jgi:hypothetical protein
MVIGRWPITRIDQVRRFEGRTFFWDGQEYASEEEARSPETDYRENGFEVRRLVVEGSVLLYTRRPVSSAEES